MDAQGSSPFDSLSRPICARISKAPEIASAISQSARLQRKGWISCFSVCGQKAIIYELPGLHSIRYHKPVDLILKEMDLRGEGDI